MNMKESDLLLLEVAHLAMGTHRERLSFSERGSAVWEAFQIGKAYAEAITKESPAARTGEKREGKGL